MTGYPATEFRTSLSRFILLLFTCLYGNQVWAQHHVTMNGSSSGHGTLQAPWDLRTALLAPPTVSPGDTIWVHGGRYAFSKLVSLLRGEPGRPIIVRNFSGERAQLVHDDVAEFLTVQGSYTWFWGLEFFDAHIPPLATEYGGSLILFGSDAGTAAGNKLVQCVVHDAMVSGVGDWIEADNTEISGCLFYFNGRKVFNDNFGYGIYAQNDNGYKVYRNNVFLNNFGGYQIHLYTEAAKVDSFLLLRNVIASTSSAATLLVSGNDGVRGIVVDSNAWFGPNMVDDLFRERKGLVDPVIRGNRLISGRLSFRSSTTGRVFAENTSYGGFPYETTSGGEDNPWDTTGSAGRGNMWYFPSTSHKPVGVDVSVHIDPFDSSLASVVVYNWDQRLSFDLDIAKLVPVGNSFVIHDCQNYYGEPVASGISTYESVQIPLSRIEASIPVSSPSSFGKILHTDSRFNVFWLTSGPSTRQIGLPEGEFSVVEDSSTQWSYRLRWIGSNAFGGLITPGIGLVPASGELTVPRQLASAYQLTLSGPGGDKVVELQLPDPDKREDVPEDLLLEQNYPNPFNPETTIEFRLRSSEVIRLEVFDILGQRVASLVDGPMNAGIHRVRFVRDSEGSGVYYYRLMTASHSEIRQMILLR